MTATLKTYWNGLGAADRYVAWIALALAALGAVAVYSATAFLAGGAGTTDYLARHVVRIGVALGAMALFSVIDYRFLARISKPLLIGALGLLVAVKLVGVARGGAQRWIELAGVGFQPSELARGALLLYVATLLVRKQGYIKSFGRAFTPVFFWVFATIALIGMDDLSTAFIVLMAVMLMCFVARVSVLQLGGLAAAGLAGAFLLLCFSPNRAARMEAYTGMNLFPGTETEKALGERAEGYQAKQAKIAIARGGLLGVGPGKGVQRDFLPAPYNDFIFAIVAEEYGLLGAGVLLVLFGAFLFRGLMRIARHAPDPLGLVLATGLTVTVALYGFVNAGVACGLLPVTGLPMPMVSYGGTAMLSNGIMLGILLNISRHAAG
ncbi:MAG: cell division protein FtsW [Bacteroidetes bacterium QS_8_68_28]|jgi:cell division protein FtsW|nr:MAG: cell division protein FtsW [Bacteroidetes bacterium QS_8_68_28]